MVIQQTASLVGAAHKVNLTKPDKIIIVEVFQVRELSLTAVPVLHM
jgi:tRNA(Ser,Leu) C12 N-acetylase TAN1